MTASEDAFSLVGHPMVNSEGVETLKHVKTKAESCLLAGAKATGPFGSSGSLTLAQSEETNQLLVSDLGTSWRPEVRD